jgi:hypothetical protein
VEYKFNKKAWMTSDIFTEWLRKLDRRFQTERRKVLMIVDNCPAHPHVDKLQAIKLEFLPPNATSRLQPCDMGIIKNVKVKYRRLKALRLIEALEKKTTYEVNILDAMNLLRKAWASVTQQTIANCFRKAGFTCAADPSSTTDATDSPTSDDDFDDEDDLPLSRLLPDGVLFNEYATVDDAVETCDTPSDDEIVRDVITAMNPAATTDADNSDDEEDTTDADNRDPPTRAQAVDALDMLQRYLYGQGGSNDAQTHLLAVEQFIIQPSRNLTQRSVTDFLTSSRE